MKVKLLLSGTINKLNSWEVRTVCILFYFFRRKRIIYHWTVPKEIDQPLYVYCENLLLLKTSLRVVTKPLFSKSPVFHLCTNCNFSTRFLTLGSTQIQSLKYHFEFKKKEA